MRESNSTPLSFLAAIALALPACSNVQAEQDAPLQWVDFSSAVPAKALGDYSDSPLQLWAKTSAFNAGHFTQE